MPCEIRPGGYVVAFLSFHSNCQDRGRWLDVLYRFQQGWNTQCFWLNPWITRNLNSRQSLDHTPMLLFPESENHREWLIQRAQLSQHLLSTYCVLGSVLAPQEPHFPCSGKSTPSLNIPYWYLQLGAQKWSRGVPSNRGRASTVNLMYALLLSVFLKDQLKWTFPIPMSLSPILTVELWWKLFPRLLREFTQLFLL